MGIRGVASDLGGCGGGSDLMAAVPREVLTTAVESYEAMKWLHDRVDLHDLDGGPLP